MIHSTYTSFRVHQWAIFVTTQKITFTFFFHLKIQFLFSLLNRNVASLFLAATKSLKFRYKNWIIMESPYHTFLRAWKTIGIKSEIEVILSRTTTPAPKQNLNEVLVPLLSCKTLCIWFFFNLLSSLSVTPYINTFYTKRINDNFTACW